jgi:hypothetical protein
VRTTLVLATATVLALGLLGVAPAGAEQSAPTTQHTSTHVDRHKHKHKHKHKIFSLALGQVGNGACNVGAPAAVVIDTSAAGAPTYVATESGVITSFSHQANGVLGRVQAVVFADGPTSSQKVVVAKSAKFIATRNILNTFPVQLPIKKGQRLGLAYSTNNMACATTGFPGDSTLVQAPFDPDVTGTFVAAGTLSATGATFRPNISAVLESDVDGDGFGDLTQDGCTASKHVQLPCPDTTITKKPKHPRTRSRVKVKVKFVASIPGSTFECRLDHHKKWKPCASPYKKKLGIGKHQLQVRAISPGGVPDPKPAKARFWIKRR